mmetsp:Transcript_39537/g.61649  ORF Transcript_39537/g.61649 Transcript_39537/m.61649 type:complete len:110 (+) Transcript_39537:171-500(+)
MNAEYSECIPCSQDGCDLGATRSECTPHSYSTCSIPCSAPAGSPSGNFMFISGGSWDETRHQGDDCAYVCNWSPDGRRFWKNNAIYDYCVVAWRRGHSQVSGWWITQWT